MKSDIYNSKQFIEETDKIIEQLIIEKRYCFYEQNIKVIEDIQDFIVAVTDHYSKRGYGVQMFVKENRETILSEVIIIIPEERKTE